MFADAKSINPTQIFLSPRDASRLQRNGRLCLFSAAPAQQKEEGTDLKGMALSGCVQVSQVQKSIFDIPLNIVQIITNRCFSLIKKGDAQVARMITSL